MQKLLLILSFVLAGSVVSAQDIDSTEIQEPETFEMEWKDSTIVMQKHFVVFLKSGLNRSQNEEETQRIQQQHMQHLEKLALQGKTSITGPMGGDGDIRGIVIYNSATAGGSEAAGRSRIRPLGPGALTVEVQPWWAAMGSKLK
ncbi:MAG: hypothetical protein U5J63_04170 [Fodinibius sp.]|nr:hypothetical protein [Fodinibius sp.]